MVLFSLVANRNAGIETVYQMNLDASTIAHVLSAKILQISQDF